MVPSQSVPSRVQHRLLINSHVSLEAPDAVEEKWDGRQAPPAAELGLQPERSQDGATWQCY